MMDKKMHRCSCGGDVEISKKTLGAGMDGCYQNWEICCKKCGGNWQWAADEFYGRKYYSKDEVIDLWNDSFEPKEEAEKSRMKDYYRSFLVRDYSGGIFLAKSLERELEELQGCGWQIVSVTPHVVNRGKSNEHLEYIIVATAEIEDEERKENEIS